MSDIKCVVPISGGKDSQACLKLALNEFDAGEIRGLFCDTQFEHPATYEHIDRMRQIYGVRIDTVTGGSVLEKSVKYGRFPGGGARHCTDELKIRETKIYLKALAEQQGDGFEVWYGMRTKESAERAKRYAGKIDNELYPPHEVMPSKYPKYLSGMGVMFRLPIIDWSESQVLELLAGEENPLYAQGFPRVGCFPCLASGDKWKLKAFAHDKFGNSQLIAVTRVSQQIGKSCFTSKSGLAGGASMIDSLGIVADNDNDDGHGRMVCSI